MPNKYVCHLFASLNIFTDTPLNSITVMMSVNLLFLRWVHLNKYFLNGISYFFFKFLFTMEINPGFAPSNVEPSLVHFVPLMKSIWTSNTSIAFDLVSRSRQKRYSSMMLLTLVCFVKQKYLPETGDIMLPFMLSGISLILLTCYWIRNNC